MKSNLKPKIGFSKPKNELSMKKTEIKSNEKLISLNIVNTTKTNQKALLFGRNIYLLSPNFGSDVNAKVSHENENISYLQILQTFSDRPFETKLIRLRTKNKKQLQNVVNYYKVYCDDNEHEEKTTFHLSNYSIKRQEGFYVLDMDIKIVIDGNSWLDFFVQKNTGLFIDFYGTYLDDFDKYSNKNFLQVLYALFSCQLQQGKDFVTPDLLLKTLGRSISYESILLSLGRLVQLGHVVVSDEGYGVKLNFLKYDSSIEKVLLTSMIKKSEINL